MDKLKEKLARFMYGRYGSDRLNIFMVIVLLMVTYIPAVSMFLPNLLMGAAV